MRMREAKTPCEPWKGRMMPTSSESGVPICGPLNLGMHAFAPSPCKRDSDVFAWDRGS